MRGALTRQGRRTAALLFLLLLWFQACTRRGLFIDFYADDMMNMNRAVTELRGFRGFISILWPYTSVYRPVGALYYKTVYVLFGLHPLAFRSVTYAFLFLGVILSFFLARRLSGRTEIAFIAAMLWAYHHRFNDIYFNNGTVYDVLCFTFYIGAFLFYVRIRESRKDLRWRHVTVFTVLFLLALNSKEMAVTLPAVIAAWEIIYYWAEKPWRRPGVIACVLVTLGLSAGAAIVKQDSHSAFYGNAAYDQHVTLATYLSTNGQYLDDVTLHERGFFTPAMTIGVFTGAIVLALLLRSRLMLLAAIFAIVATLPVSFIATRSLFAVCISYFGWTLFAAGGIVTLRDRLLPARLANSRLQWAVPALTTALLALVFIRWQKTDPYQFTSYKLDPGRERIRLTLADLERAHVCPQQPSGSLLFVHDRWPNPDFQPLFAARLVCHDPELKVDFPWLLNEWRIPMDYSKYTWVIDYKDGHIIARHGTDFARTGS